MLRDLFTAIYSEGQVMDSFQSFFRRYISFFDLGVDFNSLSTKFTYALEDSLTEEQAEHLTLEQMLSLKTGS